MPEIISKLIKTDVTFVKIYVEHIICGVGGYLHIFNFKNSNKLIHRETIFEGLKINCVCVNQSGDRLLCTGENIIKLYSADFSNIKFFEIAVKEISDWILDTRWIHSNLLEEIVTVTMHNKVNYWNNSLEFLRETVCEENCILYCAQLSINKSGDLIVLAGTVFSEILIWRPYSKLYTCPVLKRLCGHNGVLFSIDHDPIQNIISSTSDDRSTILWKYDGDMTDKETTFDLKKLYGHTARCFRSRIIKNYVISTGEDGIINIWNLDGTLKRSMEAHQGRSIWCIDADYEQNLLVTGGADSGVTMFMIEPKIVTKTLSDLDDVPKKVGILKNNDVIVITESGLFYYYKNGDDKHKWTRIAEHKTLQSYCLLEVSPCGNQVALAGFRGHIYIYKLITDQLKLICSMQTTSMTRIYSLHWLNCDTIVTCESDGLLYLRCKYPSSELLLLLAVFQLPAVKERWSTCACVCHGMGGGIVVGDRKGNIHFYRLDSFQPVQTLKRAHNYLGVTTVDFEDGIVTSLGRDSTVRKYKLEDKLIQISEDKLPFSWLMSLDKSGLLTAFSGTNIIFWDYKTRRLILEMDCGGGHRSNSFNKNDKQLNFIYIKDKLVNEIMFKWNSILARDLFEGINSDEINALGCIKINNYQIFISGGEDTTLRLFKYNQEIDFFQQYSVFKSHLSSIRCLHLHKLNESEWYIFSAGGRAQIIMWKIEEAKCIQLHSFYEQLKADESEIRVMDLSTVIIKKEILLLAACSDGKIKVYTVNSKGLVYSHCFQYDLKCILKLFTIQILENYLSKSTIENNECTTVSKISPSEVDDNFAKDVCVIVSMATDGLLAFWNFYYPENHISTFLVHQSGINAYSLVQMEHHTYIILTGGDDNTLTISKFTILRNPLEVICNFKYSKSDAHCAQITGVFISREGYFLSAGLDKRLLLFKFEISDNGFECICIGTYETSISDVKGMEVFETGHGFEVTLYGLGLEVLNVNKNVNHGS